MSPALAKEAIYASHKALIEGGTGLIRVVSAPSTPTSSGKVGQIAVSGQYFYAATGENKWGRAAISLFSVPLFCNNSSVYCNNTIIYCNATQYQP
jgi:hypothetical protein